MLNGKYVSKFIERTMSEENHRIWKHCFTHMGIISHWTQQENNKLVQCPSMLCYLISQITYVIYIKLIIYVMTQLNTTTCWTRINITFNTDHCDRLTNENIFYKTLLSFGWEKIFPPYHAVMFCICLSWRFSLVLKSTAPNQMETYRTVTQ